MKIRNLLLSLFLLVIAGCASQPPENAKYFSESTAVEPGYAKLYIYRPKFQNGSAVWPEVFLNETKVVGLKNHAYTLVFAEPGKYKIRTERSHIYSGMGNIPGEIEIQGTKDHFLFLDQYYCQTNNSNAYCLVQGLGTDYQRWVLREKSEAMPILENCYYIEPYARKISNAK